MTNKKDNQIKVQEVKTVLPQESTLSLNTISEEVLILQALEEGEELLEDLDLSELEMDLIMQENIAVQAVMG